MLTAITASVTSGPAAAIANSAPGVSGSFGIRAMPPKNHRSICSIWIPSRRATSAWPSSCRISKTKNKSALATATRNAVELEPPRTV